MRCIYCGLDSNKRERGDGRCPGCGKRFCFDPPERGGLTDMAFQSMIDAVSAKGRVRWGSDHLYYEVCRRQARVSRKERNVVIVGGLLAGGLFSFAWGTPIPFVLFGAFSGAFSVMTFVGGAGKLARFKRVEFDKLFSHWCQVHGPPAGLIVRPPDQPILARLAESDLADYSFDRAVICDRARTVDVLLANNFHFENNCAVLGVEGYPRASFEVVRAMLKRNPRLQVFALHDASAEGCRLAHKLATDPNWFKGGVKVIDVGLRPRHAESFKGVWGEYEGQPLEDGSWYLPGEARWLRKYRLELAAVRPEQVIKRLFRGMTNAGPPAGNFQLHVDEHTPSDDMGETVGMDFDAFSADADASDGGGDSFG